MELTRILDNLKDADGNLANGRLVIECPNFIAADGAAVATSVIAIPITNGAVDFLLAPTAGSSPAVKYTVTYFLKNTAKYEETWTVPAIGPITIAQARGF
ncbi:MAG: hypothetical protein A3H28_06290 [Acidobacteria bacterium RIFCSPLOWO2_02_FULL_61_28]|nr:MAG: hypothetical protein A3H28_06290 [Acidobacteria bacterium RIFCSPLOWO2_02_FULL_61_28]